ncbi:Transmembrane protein 66 precursor [Schistosoma japonicum]|nr:Transmembrane protein 66 precursor [Schistosoma japonicum]KAH8874799.1 Transmembrane protein 66 precursor [Schistosoma japonicum]
MGSSQSRSRWNWNKVENQSGSWLSNGLAAGAGFLGGYFMGSRSHSNPGSSSSGCYSRTEPIFTEEPCIRNGDIYSDSSFSSHSRRSRTPSPETHISSGNLVICFYCINCFLDFPFINTQLAFYCFY